MANIVRFPRPIRRRCTTSRTRSRPSSINLLASSRSAKQQTVSAANVFQQLALENRFALAMLENLGRTMLIETRRHCLRGPL